MYMPSVFLGSCPAFWLFGSIVSFDTALCLNPSWFFPLEFVFALETWRICLMPITYLTDFPRKLVMFPPCWLWLLLISLEYCCESCSLSLDDIIVTTKFCCSAILLLLSFIHGSKSHFAVVFYCSYVWLSLSQSLFPVNASFSLKEALLPCTNLRFLILSVQVKICLL